MKQPFTLTPRKREPRAKSRLCRYREAFGLRLSDKGKILPLFLSDRFGQLALQLRDNSLRSSHRGLTLVGRTLSLTMMQLLEARLIPGLRPATVSRNPSDTLRALHANRHVELNYSNIGYRHLVHCHPERARIRVVRKPHLNNVPAERYVSKIESTIWSRNGPS